MSGRGGKRNSASKVNDEHIPDPDWLYIASLGMPEQIQTLQTTLQGIRDIGNKEIKRISELTSKVEKEGLDLKRKIEKNETKMRLMTEAILKTTEDYRKLRTLLEHLQKETLEQQRCTIQSLETKLNTVEKTHQAQLEEKDVEIDDLKSRLKVADTRIENLETNLFQHTDKTSFSLELSQEQEHAECIDSDQRDNEENTSSKELTKDKKRLTSMRKRQAVEARSGGEADSPAGSNAENSKECANRKGGKKYELNKKHWPCKLCPKRLSSKDSLKRHCTQLHKNLENPSKQPESASAVDVDEGE